MSSHAATKINQKEYLKKYLSGDTKTKKKRKKKDKDSKRLKAKTASGTMSIIDDDFAGNPASDNELAEELLYAGEDAPQIVGEYIAAPSEAMKWRSIAVKKEEIKEEDDDDDNELNAITQPISQLTLPVRIKEEKRTPSPTLDLSPPRQRKGIDREKSARHHHSRSPENHRKRRNSEDFSPPRRSGRAASRDLSPPRKGGARDLSPPRRKKRRDSNDDQSPPRRRHRESPPSSRKRSENSSSRRERRRSHSREESRSRRRHPSPARVKSERRSVSPSRSRNRDHFKREKQSPNNRYMDSPPPTHKPKTSATTLDGKKAGLQNAASVRNETEERRHRENEMYSKMSDRDTEVRVRATGRRGKRGQEAADENPELQRQREERAKQKKEVYDLWGKGVKQVEAHRQRLAEQEHESNKPLARHADDDDLERHLREQERDGDPMLEYLRKKKRERQVESGQPVMPVYQGNFPQNRFDIRPGYRWDGVDRSNGYELRWFTVQNEKKAREEEAYLYSVEDM